MRDAVIHLHLAPVLFSHYGLNYGERRSPTGLPETSGQHMTDAYGAPGAQGYDTSGPTTDEAMTRSEERIPARSPRWR